MNNPFRTTDDYELFIYSLQQQFSEIENSTLVFVRRGASNELILKVKKETE